METTDFIWFNGKFVPWNDAKIHVLTHALHYGSGAFEGIRFYATSEGPAIFRLNEHVNRLIYSANALYMPLQYTREEIRTAIIETVRKNKLPEGYIRPLVFYGYSKMGVNPTGNPVDMIVACWPWGAYHGSGNLDVKTSKYIRIHPDSTIVDAKICGHYINSMLAGLALRGTHYHEALLLDADGYVCEGSAVNFFMVKDGVIYTPTLGSILAGVTRDFIIKLAKHYDYQVVETQITVEQVYQADEAFFTGTAAEVGPIRSLDDKIIGTGEPGPITTKLKNAYQNVVHGKDEEFRQYLTYVSAVTA